MGEDLDTLSLKELQNLEHQLETALKHIRSKKVNWVNSCVFLCVWYECKSNSHCFYLQNQLMFESISELQKKVRSHLCSFA